MFLRESSSSSMAYIRHLLSHNFIQSAKPHFTVFPVKRYSIAVNKDIGIRKRRTITGTAHCEAAPM